MKTLIIFGFLWSLVSGCSHLQSSQRGVATIEFDRQEDNGFVNIVPCTLVLSDQEKIELSGGQRAVVSVAPGNFYVVAYSIDPYSPNFDEKAWCSPPMRFRVASGETFRVSVEPASSDSTYTGGWIIHAGNEALHDHARTGVSGGGRSANL